MNRSITLILLLAFVPGPLLSVAQNERTLHFKIAGTAGDTVYLANYYGNKLFYADTAVADAKGQVTFDRKKGYRSGVYAVVVPGPKYFEFIVNEPRVRMETKVDDLMGAMLVKESKENSDFFAYIRFLNDRKALGDELKAQREATELAGEIASIDDRLKELDKEVTAYQQGIVDGSPDSFLAMIVRMSMPVPLDQVKKVDGSLDSSANYYRFRAHYWDHVDLTDERILYTPVFQNKFDEYIGRVVPQVPDTISALADDLIGRMEGNRELFKFAVHNITYKYETSDIMGMDAVFVHMALTYYCPAPGEDSRAFWLSEEKLDKLCERARKMAPLVIGAMSEDLILTDTTETNWIGMHSLPNEYVLLAFWDPHCGHCKKEIPKVHEYYQEHLKDLDLEVYSVAKATDNALFKDWKKFIVEHGLDWVNVGLTVNVFEQAKADPLQFIPKYTTLKSLNYSETYDVFSTPKFFLLDGERRIIGKQLAPEQIKDLIMRRREKAVK
ncbi:MAG: DUF5106 domain-containing protein [Flavobacteriales bacterium]|nr:DUF5106 domain-containing protein [Flavobacteriales bacterium]